jgi:F-type H+-transporting ATPase subunit b
MKCQKLRAGTKTVLMLVLALVVLCLPVAGMASGGGEGHDEHGGGATPGWVATDTYRVMNFVVLAGALIFLLRKPLSQALDSRIKGIRVQLEDLEAKKSAAEKELAKYASQIAELSKESDKIIAEYIRQGNDAKAKILQEAEAAAIKLEEQAKRNIEHEFQQAKEKLQAEIIEKALEKAESRIKSKITAEDQNVLIDEYLQKVVA